MTKEEIDKISAELEETWKEVNQWRNSLSDEEKKEEAEKSKDTRLWEDWTDCDPISNAISRSNKK